MSLNQITELNYETLKKTKLAIIVSHSECIPCYFYKEDIENKVKDIFPDVYFAEAAIDKEHLGSLKREHGPFDKVPVTILYNKEKFLARIQGKKSVDELSELLRNYFI